MNVDGGVVIVGDDGDDDDDRLIHCGCLLRHGGILAAVRLYPEANRDFLQ